MKAAVANLTKSLSMELADRRIRKAYNNVVHEGRSIDENSASERLHELRKSCKKLRYLLEFFQSLYPRETIKPLIRSLKDLLENLGDFQDLEVQTHTLQHYAAEMTRAGETQSDTLLAIGALIDRLATRQQDARDAFEDTFAGFDGKDHRRALTRLLDGAARRA